MKSARKKFNTVQVNVRFPEPMLKEIDRHLDPQGFGQSIDRTEFIRKAVDEYLQNQAAYIKYPKFGSDEKGRLVLFNKGKFHVFKTEPTAIPFDSFDEMIKHLYPDGVNRLTKL